MGKRKSSLATPVSATSAKQAKISKDVHLADKSIKKLKVRKYIYFLLQSCYRLWRFLQNICFLQVLKKLNQIKYFFMTSIRSIQRIF